MKIAVLGTGVVGQTMGAKLVGLGHDVMMGARSADNEKALTFAAATGGRTGDFATAAAHGQLVIHCTRGDSAIDVLRQAGAANLAGKVLVDISNPLDFSAGFPPSLSVSNTDSLGEVIQREFSEARVVKTLNTVTASVMVDPGRIPGNHVVFLSGNDAVAKGTVADLLRSFGWQAIIDLGDITSARATEQMLPLWTRLYSKLGTGEFNFAVLRRSD
jgi:predicted dinucleotide-binding enzyme